MTTTCYFVKQATGATAPCNGSDDNNDGVVLQEAIDETPSTRSGGDGDNGRVQSDN